MRRAGMGADVVGPHWSFKTCFRTSFASRLKAKLQHLKWFSTHIKVTLKTSMWWREKGEEISKVAVVLHSTWGDNVLILVDCDQLRTYGVIFRAAGFRLGDFGPLGTSGNVWRHGSMCYCCLAGRNQDAAKQCTMHRTVPYNKALPSPKCRPCWCWEPCSRAK